MNSIIDKFIKNKLYSGVIYDAIYTDLKYKRPLVLENIFPVWDSEKTSFIGEVFTCKGKETVSPNENIRIEMFQNHDMKNKILLLKGNSESSVFGDITAKMAKRSGCQACIIDGYTRDVQFIEEIKFPTFARGTKIIDTFNKWNICDFSCNLVIKNVFIHPNDFIFIDKDGIIVLPKELINKIYDFAIKRVDREIKMRQFLDHSSDYKTMYERYGKW